MGVATGRAPSKRWCAVRAASVPDSDRKERAEEAAGTQPSVDAKKSRPHRLPQLGVER